MWEDTFQDIRTASSLFYDMFLLNNIDYENFDFSKDYYQVFKKSFNNSVSPQVVIKLKVDNKIFSYDIALANFLFDVRFATLNQINEFFRKWLEKNDDIKSKFDIDINRKSRLYRLEDYRIVNSFLISDDEKEAYEESEDYLKVYALDLGGKGLIVNFTDCNYWDWKYTDNIRDPRQVIKDLAITDFYLKLLDTNMTYFTKNVYVYQGKNSFVPGFKTTVKAPTGKDNCFYGDVFLRDETQDVLMDRLIKYESMLSTNTWKKYSEEEPILLFIVDDIETAARVCETADKYLIKHYRLITFKDLKEKGLIDGFYKYNAQKKLQRVKSTHFAITQKKAHQFIDGDEFFQTTN